MRKCARGKPSPFPSPFGLRAVLWQCNKGAARRGGKRGKRAGKAKPAPVIISPYHAGGDVTACRKAGVYGVFPLFQKSKQGRGAEQFAPAFVCLRRGFRAFGDGIQKRKTLYILTMKRGKNNEKQQKRDLRGARYSV